MDSPGFLTDPPQFLFFTGKGGVGKTSLACASAIQLASSGARVLLVSTDPASNISQVLGLSIGNAITAIPEVPGLSALEINPEQAAQAYRERIIGPVRDLLPEREIVSITEQLSGSCTTEIASFNEFTDLLTSADIRHEYSHVVFDTAPTGHTIRLLQLPGSWTDFLNEGKGDASCLGPLAGLEKQRATYAEAVASLKDPGLTRMILVTRAQQSALTEVERTRHELQAIGITDSFLVVNGVLPSDAHDDPLTSAIRSRENQAIEQMDPGLLSLHRDTVTLKPTDMVGVRALRSLLRPTEDAVSPVTALRHDVPDLPLRNLVDEVEADGHGLVMCMGKGGVGKTTVAAAIAVALARRGHDVLLTTTDPAAHLTDTLHGGVTGLEVSRIDPVEATRVYRDRIMATKGGSLDDAGRAVLTEDLMSPCTEEIAVFQQFSRIVHLGRRRFVIVDTAPTGHTLLLLDAAGSYHRDVARQMGVTDTYTTPLMRLQDPKQTKVIIVTLAEPTPVGEARGLQTDLERAGIQPWAWVINNCLAAAHPRSNVLQARAHNELALIAELRDTCPRLAIVPSLVDDPVGQTGLAALTE